MAPVGSVANASRILTDDPLDVGKVLAGIQVPPEEFKEFDDFLTNLGYHYVEETDNEVYKRFLRK